MKDPFQTLGVSPTATEEEIKTAYRSLARRYHPDNYANDQEGARFAEAKMKEINEAYDFVCKNKGKENAYTGQGTFAAVRENIRVGMYADAEKMLDGMESEKTFAEWHYLKSVLLARRGWQSEAIREIETACQMDPDNKEYENARQYYARRSQSFGRAYRTPEGNGRPRRECDVCDVCTTLYCLDCACECCGSDCIRCI